MNIALDNLKAVVARINDAVGNPIHGAHGNYRINMTHSGWALEQFNTINDNDITQKITPGCVSTQELYGQLLSFLEGVDAAQQLTVKN